MSELIVDGVGSASSKPIDLSLDRNSSAPETKIVSEADEAAWEAEYLRVEDAEGPAPTSKVAPSEETGMKTLGDVILQNLETMSETYAEKLVMITETLPAQSGEFTMHDMFRLQAEVMQLNLQQDVMSKVADKCSQGVQALFRNQ